MSIDKIKEMVRESLAGLVREKEATPEKKEGKKKKADDRNLDQKDQSAIQGVFDDELSPSYMDACKASGMIKKHSELSNCIQKIKQKNDQGLQPDEKSDLTKALKGKMQ